MDGHGGYYAKLNKSDRERQILYDITYMWTLKNTKQQQQKNKNTTLPQALLPENPI